MSEWRPVPQGTGFTFQHADIVPGIVDRIVTAKLPGMVGNKLAVQIIKQLEDIEQEEFEELAIEEGETL